MNRFGVAGLLMLSLCTSHAASPIYINFGTITNIPQVDAVSFANHGLFSVDTVLPYTTQNTLNFTNTGVMTGTPGFRFQLVTAEGERKPAANFYNGFDAHISAGGGISFLPGTTTGTTFSGFGFTFENPQLLVAATNIFNRGHLHADGGGLVNLTGHAVDVGRSSIGILPLFGGGGFTTPTNFFPDAGITDIYWGMNGEGNQVFAPGSLAQPIPNTTNFVVSTPLHTVTNQTGIGFDVRLSLTNAVAVAVTNAVTPTNWVIQAVFVQQAAPELGIDVRFSPSTIATNPYQTAIVELSRSQTNVLEGGRFLSTIYILDTIASETNFVQLTNLQTLTTFRPSTYEVTRVTPVEFIAGSPGDPAASTNVAALLSDPSYVSPDATNIYAAYSFNVTNLTSLPPPIPGVSLLDLPGRVEIAAGDLSLNRTRFRAEGIVSIVATNVTGTNAVFDTQNIALDLGSASGILKIENMVPETVERMVGDVALWSAVWTNQATTVTTNQVPDPQDPMQMISEVVTNVIDIGFHVMVVSTEDIITEVPVQTARFGARSGNLVIGDTLRVVESMNIAATNLVFTGTGRMILGPDAPDWNSDNVPNLVNLVNEGQISIFRDAFLGTNRARPYGTIINRGLIEAFAIAIRADQFENTGALEAGLGFFAGGAGTLTIEANQARLQGGAVTVTGDIRIGAKDLVLDGVAIESGQPVVMLLTNSVSDGGIAGLNVIASEGFHLLRKPVTGDFLGTVFESSGPPFLEVMHTWAGDDRGPRPEGFINNAAIGHLILDGQVETLFRFRGASRENALYVDFLELRGTVPFDVPSSIFIDRNLVIYFADSNVPAEQLNGLFADADAPEGRLRWVPEFVGPNSSTDVLLPSSNTIVSMNRALRGSATADSDGDGIVNKDDPFPLDADAASRVRFTNVQFDQESSILTFSWDAQPGKAYVVEYTTSLGSSNWTVLTRHTNTEKSVAPARVQADIPAGTTQRFYRVRPVSN